MIDVICTLRYGTRVFTSMLNQAYHLFLIPVIAVIGKNTRNADTKPMRAPTSHTILGDEATAIKGPWFWNFLPRNSAQYIQF